VGILSKGSENQDPEGGYENLIPENQKWTIEQRQGKERVPAEKKGRLHESGGKKSFRTRKGEGVIGAPSRKNEKNSASS